MVQVTLTMPYGLLKSFAQLMGSLEGFFKHVSYKTKLEKAKAEYFDPAEIEKREKRVDKFKKEVVRIYDDFISQAAHPREALSATNRALKQDGWPWACWHVVLGVLRETGRCKDRELKSGPKTKRTKRTLRTS